MSQITQKYSVGDKVWYKMLPADRPTDPDKEWPGIVTAVHSTLFWVEVEMLEEDFEGLKEKVRFGQITRVEKQDAHTQEDKA